MSKLQKKNRILKKSHCGNPQLEPKSLTLIEYGPPPLQRIRINQAIGYNYRRPMGLRKYQRGENHPIKVGEKYIFSAQSIQNIDKTLSKRFSSLRYLQSYSSKKSLFNICEENTVEKLHSQILLYKGQKNLIKKRKRQQIRF